MEERAWVAHAACAGDGEGLLSPSTTQARRAADRLCRLCPVLAPCASWAMQLRPEQSRHLGVLAAMTPRDRDQARRANLDPITAARQALALAARLRPPVGAEDRAGQPRAVRLRSGTDGLEPRDRSFARARLRAVATTAGVDVDAITGRGLDPVVVTARYWVARDLRQHGWSLPAIGCAVERDHSTVLYWLKRMDERPELLAQVEALDRRVQGAGTRPASG